jgi:uncharacterized protein (DUF1330 family)
LILDRAPRVITKHGGRFLVRTNDITVLRAADPPLKRFVLIAFDTVQQAKDRYHSDDMKGINRYNEQHTKGRAFADAALAGGLVSSDCTAGGEDRNTYLATRP